jgi:hypothetical protein
MVSKAELVHSMSNRGHRQYHVTFVPGPPLRLFVKSKDLCFGVSRDEIQPTRHKQLRIIRETTSDQYSLRSNSQVGKIADKLF